MSVTYDEKTHLPSSDATNAYDLLADVARVIRDEPARYNQEEWLVDAREVIVARPPACGTVGCRAGWIAVLVEGRDEALIYSIPALAQRILGFTLEDAADGDFYFYDDIHALFSGSAIYDGAGEIGSPEYAEAGARGIEEFAEKWKERLLATPIRREGKERSA